MAATFTSGFLTNTISERSAATGVTIDGVLLQDGYIKALPTTQPYVPAVNGEFGYDTTNHTYDGMVNSAAVNFVTTSNLATQANMETATSTTTYVTPGRQHFHPGMAKAWVNFDSAGTIRAAYGISSVTKNGTGDFSANFSITLSANTNVCFQVTGLRTTGTIIGQISSNATYGNVITIGGVAVNFRDEAGSLVDPLAGFIVVYGDL